MIGKKGLKTAKKSLTGAEMFKFGQKFIRRHYFLLVGVFGAAWSLDTVGLSLAQPINSAPPTSEAAPRAQTINLKFPPDLSVGRLVVLKRKWKADREKSSGTLLAEAKGTVKVSTDQPIMLIANDSVSQNMAYLGHLPANAIACLVLNGTSVTSRDLAPIARLSGLRRLELKDTDIDDSGLQFLSKLSNLQYLQLSSTLVKGTALDQLYAGSLKHLQLDNVNLLPKAFSAIAKFNQLRFLTLARAHVTDAEMSMLMHLPHLDSLIIPENRDITDLGLKKLAGLKVLRRLDVANTSVTADGLVALKDLDLKWLKVSSNFKSELVQLKLHQAFPSAKIEFDNDHHRIPAEMFAPLH